MDEARLQQLFNDLGRAPKQLALLMKYIELSGWVSRETTLKEVTKKTLLEKAGGSAAVLNGPISLFSNVSEKRMSVCCTE